MTCWGAPFAGVFQSHEPPWVTAKRVARACREEGDAAACVLATPVVLRTEADGMPTLAPPPTPVTAEGHGFSLDFARAGSLITHDLGVSGCKTLF